MKKIIEKIKELQDGLNFGIGNLNHCCQVALEQVLGIIQEEENRPFEPEYLGFKKEYENDRESVFYKTMNNRIIFDKKKELYSIDVYKFNIYSELKNIRIPNHRQGVELLRNLGVIDAD